MDDDEESEDEDFVDNGSDGSSGGDESGEAEQSEEDMSMIDESVDKDELKALAKNEQASGKRKRPGK